MSNTKAPDVLPEPALTTEAPLPVVARPSSKTGSESGSIDAAALRKEITEQVREDLRREIREAQSDKDRRLKDYDKTKATIDEIYAYVKKYPDDPEQAKREYKIDQLLNGREEQDSSRPDVGNVKVKGLADRALDTLVEAGIVDPTEQVEVRQKWAEKAPVQGYTSDEAALAGMAIHMTEFLVAKSKRNAPASAASAIAPGGGVQPLEDVAELSEQLMKMQRDNPTNIKGQEALRDRIHKLRS
jgi:hypothetical protein